MACAAGAAVALDATVALGGVAGTWVGAGIDAAGCGVAGAPGDVGAVAGCGTDGAIEASGLAAGTGVAIAGADGWEAADGMIGAGGAG